MRKERCFLNLFAFTVCAGLIGYALYAQHVLGLEPCPLCILQRVGVIALGLIFLIAGLHRPRTWGAYVYAVSILIVSITTIGLSARHLYLQHQPPGSVPACEAPLGVLLEFKPLLVVLRDVLTGSGECQKLDWALLGLSMPAWVLICVTLLGALGIIANLSSGRAPRPVPQAHDIST